jgi:hypothetical protein
MDQIGRDYVLLSLALGEHQEGIVDAYYGPPELRDEAANRKQAPQELAEGARELRARVNSDDVDSQRQRWLDRQLIALETIARKIGGEEMSYVDEVELCFDARPEPAPSEVYSSLRRRLDDLLPAGGTLHERLEARDDRLTIPVDRVAGILEWVLGEIRDLCVDYFPIPEGESLTLSLVTDEPWSAYNWYDGGLRSRIEFNTDLPTRAHHLVGTLGHEAYPGHHLENSWKEQRLYREGGHLEPAVQLINTPEAYISEGLAEVGPRLMVDARRWQDLLSGICGRAGIPLSADDAAREWEITEALRALRGSSGDAALQLHQHGKSRDEVRQFLVDDALRTPLQAQKALEFITHPLWRTYVFCYAGGEQLLTRWCAAAGDDAAQRARFFRLLTEQLTPSGLVQELAAA